MPKSKFLWFRSPKGKVYGEGDIRHIFLYFATSNISIMFYCPCQDLNFYESVLHKGKVYCIWRGGIRHIILYFAESNISRKPRCMFFPESLNYSMLVYCCSMTSTYTPYPPTVKWDQVLTWYLPTGSFVHCNCTLQRPYLNVCVLSVTTVSYVRTSQGLHYFVKLNPYSLFIFSVLCA